MENLTFYDKEFLCKEHFSSLGSVYHGCTPEDHEVILCNEADYVMGNNIFAICAKMFPDVRIYTYQLMSNHVHFIAGGSSESINQMFELFKKKLALYLQSLGRFVSLKNLVLKLYSIDDLEYFRASTAYVNRNAFVVLDCITPFSYRWGANSCYFNPVMWQYYSKCRTVLKGVDLRGIFHGKQADTIKDLYFLDNMISPFSFCDIKAGEKAFRDAKHYFYSISKNVESYGKIAGIISESVCYNDEDLYAIIKNISPSRNFSQMDANSKIETAVKLHRDYNATPKQIQRFLKLDSSVVKSLFG